MLHLNMENFNLNIIGTPSEFWDINFLKSYQFENGREFPFSYREFVDKYGYGLTLEQFHIYISMRDYGDSWNVRTEEIKSTYYDDINNDIWFDLEPDGNIELLKRLVPFSSSDNGYYLFWDIESHNQEEFDIYLTNFRGSRFRKIGESLYEVIDKLTSSEKIKSVMPFATNALPNKFQCLVRK